MMTAGWPLTAQMRQLKWTLCPWQAHAEGGCAGEILKETSTHRFEWRGNTGTLNRVRYP
jgi:hypothetical protein